MFTLSRFRETRVAGVPREGRRGRAGYGGRPPRQAAADVLDDELVLELSDFALDSELELPLSDSFGREPLDPPEDERLSVL